MSIRLTQVTGVQGIFHVIVNEIKREFEFQECAGEVNGIPTQLFQPVDTYGGTRYLHGDPALKDKIESVHDLSMANDLWFNKERRLKRYYFIWEGIWYKYLVESKTFVDVFNKTRDVSSLFTHMVIPNVVYSAPLAYGIYSAPLAYSIVGSPLVISFN